MIDAIVVRADGIPLYLEELTRTILEPGVARQVEEIPATLADSLMARLDRLSGSEGGGAAGVSIGTRIFLSAAGRRGRIGGSGVAPRADATG